MADSWLVLRCPACKICHGRKSTGHSCPHCGQRIGDNSEVVDKATDSNELRMKVVLANTPEELRAQLHSKLSEDSFLVTKEYNPSLGLRVVKDSCDDNGIIHQKIVVQKLKKNGLEIDVVDFMEHVETQGLVIRIESGKWQFLE
ncbi:MAG: hypothetical protein DWB99_08385 [Candidatus Poseidoniales archaeon]|nr:MAG: hypothetical protein DWB99_08385 [Candidatus Poseidoniales archaeon]